jgi:hypothetical protein
MSPYAEAQASIGDYICHDGSQWHCQLGNWIVMPR